MQIKLRNTFLFIAILICFNSTVLASRFQSKYPCSDSYRSCVDRVVKIIDGVSVKRDCWEYSYIKTCKYPSKNDCKYWGDRSCEWVKTKDCFLKDSLGNCVNLYQEFSCESWYHVQLQNQTSRYALKAKDGLTNLICKGVPCIDGNCVDKSYITSGEMMDSLSKLYATSKMAPDKNGNFSLFQGSAERCSKKAAGYSNCCRIKHSGWGRNVGAKCKKDERLLMDMRAKNLCVYVGRTKSKIIGVNFLTKEHFCCWGNMLDKVVQVEGRKQLGINFGSGSSPSCRGLTLQEIQRIDFNKMDFTEFIEDLKVKFGGKYKTPSSSSIASSMRSSISGIIKYDGHPNNQSNNMSGVHYSIKDDSYETLEEQRIARENSMSVRQKIEEVNAERECENKIRIEKQKRERELARQEVKRKSEELKRFREDLDEQMKQKQKELSESRSKERESTRYWNQKGKNLYKYPSSGYSREWEKVKRWRDNNAKLELELQQLRDEYNRGW